jgi:hypothetical protein
MKGICGAMISQGTELIKEHIFQAVSDEYGERVKRSVTLWESILKLAMHNRMDDPVSITSEWASRTLDVCSLAG